MDLYVEDVCACDWLWNVPLSTFVGAEVEGLLWGKGDKLEEMPPLLASPLDVSARNCNPSRMDKLGISGGGGMIFSTHPYASWGLNSLNKVLETRLVSSLSECSRQEMRNFLVLLLKEV